MIGNKICNLITLYRFPSQNQDDFQAFIDNLEMNLETLAQRNPFLMVVLGDFNAKSKHWCSQDSTNFEGITIENVTSQFGLSQIITEATHILESSSSCIDLIFTTQPNLVVESGVHPSLHPNCHHQIVFAKFNLQIYYPPPYPREIWHYKQANTELTRRAITDVNWDRAFFNTNVNEKVFFFSNTILNILSNFIPHETIVCDDKDPPWFNRAIKSLIQEKDTFNKYRKSKNNIQLLQHLRLLQEKLNSFISVSKQNYYSRMSTKLTKFHKSSKAYWSLLKTFLNNKKIPLIPPLYHQGGFITNFKVKAELFNSFFASQCSLIKNDSKLPSNLNYKTGNR